jgi:hypothetical protein
MEILFRNPGSAEDLEIDYDDWKLTRYLDAHRATKFEVRCHRRVPVRPYAKITAREGGKIHFRGYISQRSIRNKTKSITCKGDEDLLLHRYTGRAHYFPDVTRLIHPFQSAAPSQTADEYGVTWNCGLLFLANSLIPPTIWTMEDEASWTWKLPGGGSSSRIGTADIYILSGVTAIKLTERSSLALCKANDYSSYRDANDLYIQINPVDEAYFGAVLAENCFDTNVRMGVIDNPGTSIQNMQMADDRIADCLFSLGAFFEQPCKFRYAADGYTYLDSVEDDGSDAAIFDLPEDLCSLVEQNESTERYVHGLTGLGIGSRDPRHRYTKMDLDYKGVWYHDTFDVDEGFGLWNDTGGLLRSMTDDEYARRRANVSWRIESVPFWSPRPNPGHYINLLLAGETHKLRIESLALAMSGSQTMELGRRIDDLIDSFNPKSSLSDVYMYEYLEELYGGLSLNGDIQLGDSVHGLCSGYSGSITIPDDVDDAGNNHRVTLDISISLKAATSHIIGPATVYVILGGTQSPEHVFKHYMIGDSINGIDVTAKMNYGVATTVAIYCQYQGNWLPAHGGCSGHPTANVNLTFHAYKRISI